MLNDIGETKRNYAAELHKRLYFQTGVLFQDNNTKLTPTKT